MSDEDVMHYIFCRDTDITFRNLSLGNRFSLVLETGVVKICEKGKMRDIPVGVKLELPLAETELEIVLKAITVCEFLVRGIMYSCCATTKTGNSDKILADFNVLYPFEFKLDKEIEFEVFVSSSASSTDVSIESIEGKAKVSGIQLSPEKKYFLEPSSQKLVNPPNDESPCIVRILGKKRRIKISLLLTQANMNNYLNNPCNWMKSPIVLVIGKADASRTDICNFLLNEALESSKEPFYIDLNVSRSSRIPGAISLSKITGRLSDRIDFTRSYQNNLQLGVMTTDNDQYERLTDKLGKLQKEIIKKCECYSGTVINMSWNPNQTTKIIDNVLRFFNEGREIRVICIGSNTYYSHIKVKAPALYGRSMHIPERLERSVDTQMPVNAFQNYFCGVMDKNMCPVVLKVKYTNFEIYKVVDLNIVPAKCEPGIANYILGVSRATEVDSTLPLSEIEYFVFFVEVDMANEIVTLVSPKCSDLSGKILLLSKIKLQDVRLKVLKDENSKEYGTLLTIRDFLCI